MVGRHDHRSADGIELVGQGAPGGRRGRRKHRFKESFTERKLEFWVKHKEAGKLSIGQGSTASDGVAEADLSGTGVGARIKF